MVRMVLPEAKIFRKIIESVGKLADEVAFTVSNNGVSLKALDADQSSYIEVFLPPDMFLEYTVDSEETLGVSISNIKKVLKHLRKGENLIIESDGEFIEFTVSGVAKRRFKFRNLEVSVPEIPEFNLEFKVSAQLVSSNVKKALEDIESVGSIIEIDAPSNDLMVFRAAGSGKAEVKFAAGSTALLSMDVKEPSKSVYDVVKLSTILGITEVSDVVTLEFASGMPLKMEFKIGNGRITYLTAPIEAV